jgi:crotonobetainyl-CoA:carnitine CoA-transferase CaiB-like acyl-CoA transferase
MQFNPDEAAGSAYAGVRVLDFTQGVAGPMAAMLLAELGAEVVKVEPPEGDRMGGAPGYLAFNRNKEVLRLDLGTPEGMAQAMRLIAGADVAVFDHSPARLEAMGFGAELLTSRRPALIHVWTPPYGVEGQLSQLRADHSLLAAATGWGWRQAGEADQPVQMVLPIAWYGQAVLAAAAIGAALFERRRSGVGQALVVNGLHGFAEVGPPLRILNEPPLPRGIPRGVNPRYRLYPCADGAFFFLGALFPSFYRKTFEALGFGDAADQLMVDDEGAQILLDEFFATRPRDEWLALLRSAGVPCAPVGEREAWFGGETVREAGLRLKFVHPTLGPVDMPGPALALSQTPARVFGLPKAIERAPDWPERLAAATQTGRRPPLDGMRVLNLGTVIAGAYPGAMLTYLGADVAKVEAPEGDPFRYDPAFLALNRGTRSLGLDLKRPEGREAFLDLVRQADVVIDNYRPGVRERLGIDYPVLREVNPRIISCSVTAYGEASARASRPGFDPLLQAESGMMAAQGGDDDPVFLTIGVNDVASAGLVCAGVMAALNARDRTGLGQEVRTSLTAASLLFQLGELVDYAGRPPRDKGGWDCLGVRALRRHYRCTDDWIAISCETEAEAAALGSALGVALGDLAAALEASRDGPLALRIAEAIAGRKREALLHDLSRAGAPAAAVIRTAEVFQDDWLWRNGYLERWEHPVRGPVIGVKRYGDFKGSPCAFLRPSPELAQHSREVLSGYGFSPDRIERLLASGAVFDRPL